MHVSMYMVMYVCICKCGYSICVMHARCVLPKGIFIYTSFDLVFIRTCHCKCITKDCFERKWSVICWINHHTKSEGK